MTPSKAHIGFAFSSLDEAISAMRERVVPLDTERVPLSAATGRVLGQPVVTDRPSPPCDVSAMDGYAVRSADLTTATLSVVGEVEIGRPPPAMPAGAALRIFTGGGVPEACDAVVPREEVREQPGEIGLPADLHVRVGQHIRRRGENSEAGQTIVGAGTRVGPAVAGALATFGIDRPCVYRRVRLTVIVTGNELCDVSSSAEPSQLRDSNGPALAALFVPRPWIDCRDMLRVADEPDRLREEIATGLRQSDAVLLTGGVSMGDYDYVPSILHALGCDLVFHKLPIRPGKPMLAAVGPGGQAVFGLPGNPVSVLTTARRIALPVIRRRAGFTEAEPPTPRVSLVNPDQKQLALHWSRPVRLLEDGSAELVASRGSADIISAARSDGFIELPANRIGPGPWPFYRWGVSDE